MRSLTKAFSMVLIVALGVLTAGAATTQAGSMQVNVEGKLLTTEISLSGSSEAGKLLIPSQTALEIACTGAAATAKIKNEGTEVVAGTIKLTANGCTYPKSINCKIYPNLTSLTAKIRQGEIDAEGTAEIKLLILEPGKVKDLFVVVKGVGKNSRLATVLSAQEEGCIISEKIEATGSVALRIPDATTFQLSHRTEDATKADETALGLSLKYGANVAELDAPTFLNLFPGGEHSAWEYKLEP